MKFSRIQSLASFLFVPALFPVAAIAQASQPSDVTDRWPEAERSESAETLPQLAAGYARAVSTLDDARQQRNIALEDLERARGSVRSELFEAPDVEHARATLSNRRDRYVRARDLVVDRLQGNQAYTTDRKQEAAVDAKLALLRERTDSVDGQITVLATQRLHFAAEADRIEQDALGKDSAYAQAKEPYIEAVQQYETARGQIEQRVEADPAVRRAMEKWQNACDDWQDARTKLGGAQAAYLTALDEHQQRWHYLKTHGPVDPWYPYGPGYDGYGLNIP